MIAGEGTQVIHRSARDLYEFVLDLERYKLADFKIATVHSVSWRDGQAEVCYSGRFRGLKTPAVRQTVTVEPYRRIDVRSKPGTLAHLVSAFHGTFTFDELPDGSTRVYHREELTFPAALEWIIAPWLQSWLEADTPQEVLRMKALLEAEVVKDVFFYGLFMDADLLREKGIQPRAPRKAIVAGYRLRVDERAMLVSDAGARAFGMVFALTDREIATLYDQPDLEMYRPASVVASFEDGASAAVTTFNLGEALATGERNAAYAEKLRAVLEKLGFPARDL